MRARCADRAFALGILMVFLVCSLGTTVNRRVALRRAAPREVAPVLSPAVHFWMMLAVAFSSTRAGDGGSEYINISPILLSW